jgi:hypothetical protein
MRGEATRGERGETRDDGRGMMEEGSEKASILLANIVSDRPSSVVVSYDGYFEKAL